MSGAGGSAERATAPASTFYDAFYYQHGCGLPYEPGGQWLRFFGQVADRIVSGIGPRTVLDAGCAMGFLVGALRERGVEAYGMDISDYAISQVPEAIRDFCRVGTVVDPLPKRYDLIVCIEVLEHLQPADSVQALANLCQGTNDILFSSSPIDYREATHFNVQPPEYWAGLFAEHGFVRDVDFDATVIQPWSLRLRRTGAPLSRIAADYERKYWRLAHENHELRKFALDVRTSLATAEAMKSTLSWQLAQALGPWRHRLMPVGSQRERVLLRWLQGLARRAGPHV